MKMKRALLTSTTTQPLTRCSGKSTRVAYTLPHPIWQNEYVDAVEINHTPPENLTDKLALNTVRLMRYVSTFASHCCCSQHTHTHDTHDTHTQIQL
jgi:hypothetical protein